MNHPNSCTLKGSWAPLQGTPVRQIDAWTPYDLTLPGRSGVVGYVVSDGPKLMLGQTHPGMHTIHFSVVGRKVFWDESELNLRVRLKKMGVTGRLSLDRVMGGEEVTVEAGKAHRRPLPYAILPALTLPVAASTQLWEDTFREAVREMYAYHGSGPVVLMMSGGVDSVSVAKALKDIGADFVAVTAGRGEDEVDAYWAKRACAHLGIPWRLVGVPTEDRALSTLLFDTLRIIEQTGFSNVLMGMCSTLIHRWGTANGFKTFWSGYEADALFGNKPHIYGAFLKLPEHQRTAFEWGRIRWGFTTGCPPYTLQMGKNMRHGGQTIWRTPFVHPKVTELSCRMPLDASPPMYGGKPLIERILDRDIPETAALWRHKNKIGFYTGSGIGAIRQENPILSDANMRAVYKVVQKVAGQ